jgi:hypothetical protein
VVVINLALLGPTKKTTASEVLIVDLLTQGSGSEGRMKRRGETWRTMSESRSSYRMRGILDRTMKYGNIEYRNMRSSGCGEMDYVGTS